MEVILFLLGIGLAAALPLALILAVVAVSRASRGERAVEELRREISRLDTRLGALAKRVAARAGGEEPPPAPIPTPPPPPASPARAAPPPAPIPSEASRAAPSAPARNQVPQAPAAAPDFATNLGPRILVAMGALAFIVFLALFVRYAWENEWIGPKGRILLGATFSIALVAAGLRLLERELRPLGQGLMAIGLVGLYVCSFGAHAFYDLVPRPVAGAFMLVVTAAAVVLADRLDGRLLAALAWIGGYVAPALLSTGEDRAETLFLYLLVLGAGATALDHRKPWGETLPLAFLGTMALYAGWYAQHFRAERFEVAAGGLVLFTALFALGMARKERSGGLALVVLAAAAWLALLSAGADRPEVLLVLSLGIGGVALRAARGLGSVVAFAAAFAVGLPFVAWAGAHYRPESFGTAAAWLLGGMLPFIAWPPREPAAAEFFRGATLVAGAFASVGLAGMTDRPVALLLLLAVQAGLAALVRPRWSSAEAAGVAGAALAVYAWFDRFYEPDRAPEAWLLAVPLAALYLLILIGRSLIGRGPLGPAGVLAHLGNAAFLWMTAYAILYESQPGRLAALSVALAALYLVLGLAGRRTQRDDPEQVRVLLGLAAAFITIAIPVRLGLHGITLAWAVEGLLLLWLGARSGSGLAHLGGYAVLGLAVMRLFARHLPLHTSGDYTFVLNAPFGTWLFVIAILGLAVAVTRDARERFDRLASKALGALGLVLLFGLVTGETESAFSWRARALESTGDWPAARAARRQGGLALSVLWTLYATGLLAGGLFARSRPLFYSAYGLFVFTAAKVVIVDLSIFPTLYRMLSFLALGVLLLAGAWLNLRFRERLLPPRRESGGRPP